MNEIRTIFHILYILICLSGVGANLRDHDFEFMADKIRHTEDIFSKKMATQEQLVAGLTEAMFNQKQEISYLKDETSKQKEEIEKLNDKIANTVKENFKEEQVNRCPESTNAPNHQITELENKVTNLQQHLTESNHFISVLSAKMEVLENKVDDDKKVFAQENLMKPLLTGDAKNTIQYVHNAVGCVSDNIALFCTEESKINVTGALCGEFPGTCTGCCTPNLENDCTEDVVERNLEELLKIKLHCDNESMCEYLFEGVVIDDCNGGYDMADYIMIHYDCLPETKDNSPVGFTAYTTDHEVEYPIGTKIQFQEVLSNFGGFYNNAQGIFTCPYDGIYLFMADLMNYYTRDVMVSIRMDGEVLVKLWADDAGDDYHFTSASCIILCRVGQEVAIQSDYESTTIHCQDQSCDFSGYMLLRL